MTCGWIPGFGVSAAGEGDGELEDHRRCAAIALGGGEDPEASSGGRVGA